MYIVHEWMSIGAEFEECYVVHLQTSVIQINYLPNTIRELQGRTGNFREIHFLKGFQDFFVNISTRALNFLNA